MREGSSTAEKTKNPKNELKELVPDMGGRSRADVVAGPAIPFLAMRKNDGPVRFMRIFVKPRRIRKGRRSCDRRPFLFPYSDQAKAMLVRGRRRSVAPIMPKPISARPQVAGSGTSRTGAGGTASVAEAE